MRISIFAAFRTVINRFVIDGTVPTAKCIGVKSLNARGGAVLSAEKRIDHRWIIRILDKTIAIPAAQRSPAGYYVTPSRSTFRRNETLSPAQRRRRQENGFVQLCDLPYKAYFSPGMI